MEKRVKRGHLSDLKLVEMFLGLVSLRTRGCRWIFLMEQRAGGQGIDLLREVSCPNVTCIHVKRPPNKLGVSNMAVYFTWVQVG